MRREVGIAEARGERVLPVGGRERPHLCFVAPHIWPVFSRDPQLKVVGGAEVQQSILARLLAREGYRVSIVTFDYGQPRRIELDGVTVHKTCRPGEGVPVLRFLHPRLTTLWRALKEVDADAYYQRSASMLTGVIAEFCRRYGKRSIYAGASDLDFIPGNPQIRFARDRWLYEHGLRTVDRIVAQNRTQFDTCRAHYGREALLIPSCYESPAGASRRDGDLILWAATVTAHKRPELLLELARRLPQRRFVLVGGPAIQAQPDYFDGIRAAAAELPNVQMLGFLPLAEVEPWFDRARVFVNTSHYEGMPNTFLQAWARGIPTVAAVDVGAGCYPVFTDLERGAHEIERLFSDEGHWQRSSARCLEYFQANHSTGQALAHYRRLLTELTVP